MGIIAELRAESEPPTSDENGEMTADEIQHLDMARALRIKQGELEAEEIDPFSPEFYQPSREEQTPALNGATLHTEEREEYAVLPAREEESTEG